MEKAKRYNVFFKAKVVRQAWQALVQTANEKNPSLPQGMEVRDAEDTWRFDSVEEFFSAYRQNISDVYFDHILPQHRFILSLSPERTRITVKAPSRPEIEAVFSIFEDALADSPPLVAHEAAKARPIVFIGHGRSPLWRDLKDHLQDKHDCEVSAYEIGSRAGHTIRDILEEMLAESSCAFLVLTGEDETSDGRLLARQNVIHETGLFQGRLGFSRAIVLLEDGTEEFSNLAGIQQIRFSKGNIKETFGEVLAVLRREFGPQ